MGARWSNRSRNCWNRGQSAAARRTRLRDSARGTIPEHDDRCKTGSTRVAERRHFEVESVSGGPRGTGVPCADAVDWCAGRADRGGIHRDYRPFWRSALSTGCGGMAEISGSRCGIAGDGIFAVQIFSGCEGQRRPADEGGALCTRRIYQSFDRGWKVFLHVGDAGERNSIGPGGTGGSGWRRHRFGAGAGAWSAAGESEGAPAGGGRGRGGRRVQYAAGGGAVCAGGSCRRFARAGAWVGGACFRDKLGRFAVAAWQRTTFSGAAVPVGDFAGADCLRHSGDRGRRGFRDVFAIAAATARVVQAAAGEDGMVPTGGGRTGCRRDGVVCTVGDGRWLPVCGRRAERQPNAEIDADAAGVEAGGDGGELCIWERRWDFWSEPVFGSDAGRGDWKRGAAFLSGVRRFAWGLRAGRNGGRVCGNHSRADDVGGDDF